MYYTVKIQIRGITKPPVWRRLEVPADAELSDRHRAIQDSFAREDCPPEDFDPTACFYRAR